MATEKHGGLEDIDFILQERRRAKSGATPREAASRTAAVHRRTAHPALSCIEDCGSVEGLCLAFRL